MSAAGADDRLAAVLVQLGQFGERLGELDARETADVSAVREQLTQIQARLTGQLGMLRKHTEALDGLRGLQDAVSKLTAKQGGSKEDEPEYAPIPVVRWWVLLGDGLDAERARQRDEAVARLRDWVAQVYRPLGGHLAAQLGDCWPEHPLALVTLDWLSELWGVLYLNTGRDARQVGQQAELGTRILPAAAAILGTETNGCQRHSTQIPGTVRR
jgi:hypothetical protein